MFQQFPLRIEGATQGFIFDINFTASVRNPRHLSTIRADVE